MVRKLKVKPTATPLGGRLRHMGRRICAAGLCISLIFGHGVSTVEASSETSAAKVGEPGVTCFKLDGRRLDQALQKAVKKEKQVKKLLAFRGEGAEDYESLFEPDGTLYELKPKFEKDNKYMDLRVFARLEQSKTPGSRYRMEEDEEIIFLVTNKSHKERTAVIRVDGKVTEQIVVVPRSEVELEDGVNGIVSQPAAETNEETDAVKEETHEETAAVTEEETPEETTAVTEEEMPEETTAVTEDETTEKTQETTQDTKVPDTSDEKMTEAEESNIEPNALDKTESKDEDGLIENPVAAISRHQTSILTMTASPSDADGEREDEKASPSEAALAEADEKEVLEGDIYETVLLGKKTAAAFVTTAGDLGLTRQEWDLATPAQAKRLYEADLGDAVIQAYAAEGVLPEDAELHAVKLEEEGENADQYLEAKEVLDGDGTKYDGMLAYDISFLDGEGNEIEPDGNVQVKIRLNAAVLPEETDPESLVVQHLAERKDGVKVEPVADARKKTPGAVEVGEAETVAEFQVESFSKFIITWIGIGRSVDAVTYLKNAEGELNQGPYKEIRMSYGEVLKFSEQSDIKAVTYEGISYHYDYAELYIKEDGRYRKKHNIHGIKANYWGRDYTYYTYYYTADGRECSERISGDIQIRLYYKEAPRSGEEINFYYTAKDEIDNAGSVTSMRDASYMRYTIVLRDENGEEYLEDYLSKNEAAKENHPAEYKFNTKELNIGPALIDAMGISIPGYSFTEGYAYFYYDGYWSNSGNYVKVSQLLNYGAPADNGNRYDSNLAYTGTHYQGGQKINIKSLPGDYRNTEEGYYSYNPTGTLRLVFCKVSDIEKSKYHVSYVDAFSKNPNSITVHQEEMPGPYWDEKEEIFYGTVDAIWQGQPEKGPKGYVFGGWYKEKDSEGNGMGERAQTDVDEKTPFKTDVYYYAKWIPEEKSITVQKKVAGNAGNRSQKFEFTIKVNGVLVNGDDYGYSSVKNGIFSLADGQSITFHNLKYNDKVEIEENNNNSLGYETGYETFDRNNQKIGSLEGSVWYTDCLGDVCTIIFTNTKNIAVPTGIITNGVPYLLMVTGGVCGGLWFLLVGLSRRRRSRNEFI